MKIPDGDFGAYIFDCDGTLADTMPLHYKAWCAVLREHEADFPEALFYELGGMPTDKIVELLNDRHGSSMPPAETAKKKEALFLSMLAEIEPIEPVVAIVREVSGRLPMAVASGGHREVVRRTLRALGLLEKFSAVVCAEDYERGKPFPDPFLVAAERLGVEPARCLVFEDTALGEEAARAAGMTSVLVPPPARVQALSRAAEASPEG
jgi:HAD superfamily hydrolase (TIGR01509 family)